MRVLHVYKSYFPEDYGGVSQAIRHLAIGCQVHGVHADVFTCSKNASDEPIEIDGHKVHRAKTTFEAASTPLSINAVRKFHALAKQFDIIHYHYPYPYADLLSLTMARSVPSIVTYHSDIVRQRFLKYVYKPLQTSFLKNVDRIICTSPNYLETSAVLQRFHHKTEAVSLGLDEALLSQVPDDVLNKWSQELQDPFILFLGALRNYKGIETLLDASKGLNCKLVIAGAGPRLSALKQLAEEKKLTNVNFVGLINDIDKSALLSLCRALVLPSHYRTEAFGLVQLEAAMKEKPLICTELGTGTSYVNAHENTGLVVPPKDVDALRNAMNFMVYHPQLAQNMGKAAKLRFQELFTAQRMCAEYARIYNEILNPIK